MLNYGNSYNLFDPETEGIIAEGAKTYTHNKLTTENSIKDNCDSIKSLKIKDLSRKIVIVEESRL